MKTVRRGTRYLLALAVVAGLGFGATSAFAKPVAPCITKICSGHASCSTYCEARGSDAWGCFGNCCQCY